MKVTEFNYKEKYLLIDFDHTFLASSLKEEALLFGVLQPESLLKQVTSLFLPFKADFFPTHSLDKLSGGENAILAVIFYTCLIIHKKKEIPLLLNNIFESLSPLNCQKLKKFLLQQKNRGIIAFQLIDENPVPINE
jgi:hypothetical protein